MYTAGVHVVFYPHSDGALVAATVLGRRAQSDAVSDSDSGLDPADACDSDASSGSEGSGASPYIDEQYVAWRFFGL